MNTYTYSALAKDDIYACGQIAARNEKKAAAKLEKEGFLVINVKKDENLLSWKNIIVFATISRQDKIYFTRHLQSFLESGIGLDQSLKIAAEQMANKKFKLIIYDLYERIVAGQRLSTSLEAHKKYFSGYFIGLIRVGEESGRLDNTLKHLLEQQEKEYDLISKIRSAVIYPSVIISVALLVVIFILTFVIPTIATVLTDYGGTLPLSTRILIKTSNLFLAYGIYLPFILIALIIFLRYLIKKTEKGKWYFESLIFKIGIINKINKEFNLARFTRAMTAPLSSAVSIDRSLELAADTTSNSHYRKSVKEGLRFVHKGIPVSEVLRGYPRLYPPTVTRMVEIGEKTGKMDHMFGRLAAFYEKSVSETFTNLSSVIEPLLMVAIGLIVAFVAVSVLTPIWRFAETI